MKSDKFRSFIFFIFLTLGIAALIIRCTPEKKFRSLSFFFDGVPDPTTKTDLVVSAVADSSLVAIATTPAIKPEGSEHKPFAEEKCTSCHASGFSNKLLLPLPTLCYTCHENFNKKYASLHGPVASGNCLMCHDKHESKYNKLLLRKGQDLCLFCHQAKQIFSNTKHKTIGDKNCTECHNPHGGENSGLLNKDMCYNCHDNFNKKFTTLHGPVASGNCSACHDSHQSKSPKLLLRESQELCLSCHNKGDILKNAAHKTIKKTDCTQCHNPHGGEDRLMLKAAISAAEKIKEAERLVEESKAKIIAAQLKDSLDRIKPLTIAKDSIINIQTLSKDGKISDSISQNNTEKTVSDKTVNAVGENVQLKSSEITENKKNTVTKTGDSDNQNKDPNNESDKKIILNPDKIEPKKSQKDTIPTIENSKNIEKKTEKIVDGADLISNQNNQNKDSDKEQENNIPLNSDKIEQKKLQKDSLAIIKPLISGKDSSLTNISPVNNSSTTENKTTIVDADGKTINTVTDNNKTTVAATENKTTTVGADSKAINAVTDNNKTTIAANENKTTIVDADGKTINSITDNNKTTVAANENKTTIVGADGKAINAVTDNNNKKNAAAENKTPTVDANGKTINGIIDNSKTSTTTTENKTTTVGADGKTINAVTDNNKTTIAANANKTTTVGADGKAINGTIDNSKTSTTTTENKTTTVGANGKTINAVTDNNKTTVATTENKTTIVGADGKTINGITDNNNKKIAGAENKTPTVDANGKTINVITDNNKKTIAATENKITNSEKSEGEKREGIRDNGGNKSKQSSSDGFTITDKLNFRMNHEYNKTAIEINDKIFEQYIDNLVTLFNKNGSINLTILSSASQVPTKTFDSNKALAISRAEKGKEQILDALKEKGLDVSKVKFIKTRSIVAGPVYNSDYLSNKSVYEKYQYISITAY